MTKHPSAVRVTVIAGSVVVVLLLLLLLLSLALLVGPLLQGGPHLG